MRLTSVIRAFSTGTYTVTRQGPGTFVNGQLVPGEITTLPVVACIQPLSGRDFWSLPEGQQASETRVLSTTTELFTRDTSHGPDRVSVDGESWLVIGVERWQSFGETHYWCSISRESVP